MWVHTVKSECELRNPPGVHKELYQNWKHVLDLVRGDGYYWSEWNMEQQKKKKKEQSAANDQTPHTNRHHHFSAEWTIMTVSDQIEYVD